MAPKNIVTRVGRDSVSATAGESAGGRRPSMIARPRELV